MNSMNMSSPPIKASHRQQHPGCLVLLVLQRRANLRNQQVVTKISVASQWTIKTTPSATQEVTPLLNQWTTTSNPHHQKSLLRDQQSQSQTRHQLRLPLQTPA